MKFVKIETPYIRDVIIRKFNDHVEEKTITLEMWDGLEGKLDFINDLSLDINIKTSQISQTYNETNLSE